MDGDRRKPARWTSLGAAALGAAVMYFVDPQGGARRRARARDQAVHAVRRLKAAAWAAAYDARNRARGRTIETMARATDQLSVAPAGDDVLVARVRAELGHTVPHPRSIEVTAEEGTVTLSGFVEVDHLERLLHRVRAIPGVDAVQNHLLAYQPEAEPAYSRMGTGAHADHAGDEPPITHARVPLDVPRRSAA
jgi:hypothetical protein